MSLERLQAKRNFLETFFPAQVLGKSAHPQFPLNTQISWREYALDSSGQYFTPLSRRSGGDIEAPQFPATLICPPTCTLIASKLPNGTDVFGYQPCVHVFGGVIIGHNGTTNPSYTVRTFDYAIEKSGLLPMDRETGVNYQPLPDQSVVLLICMDNETLKLIAFEPEPTVPPGTAALFPGQITQVFGGPGATYSAVSFDGLQSVNNVAPINRFGPPTEFSAVAVNTLCILMVTPSGTKLIVFEPFLRRFFAGIITAVSGSPTEGTLLYNAISYDGTITVTGVKPVNRFQPEKDYLAADIGAFCILIQSAQAPTRLIVFEQYRPLFLPAKITVVTPGPPVTYSAQSDDLTTVVTGATPLNRWGVGNWLPLSPNAPCFLMRSTTGVKLIAFETPGTTSCPAPASGAPAPAPVGADNIASFIGL